MYPWLFGTEARLGHHIAEAEARTRRAENDLAGLEGRVSALENACGGMWRLLKIRHGYTDEQLFDAIREIGPHSDDADAHCPSCRRKLLIRKARSCSWCGQAIPERPVA